MATVWWVGNAKATAMSVQAQVTAVAVGGTLVATMNGKTVTYTCVTGDTITTATAAWFALLSDTQTAPPEMNEQTWTSPATDKIVATATVPGTPFAGMTGGLVFTATGGAAVTQTTLVANSSPSDVGIAQNWRRGGVAGLPQNGDVVTIADSDVPLLWNLTALAAIQFLSFTRWQSFTGTIGLPENNPNGYYEYRPTYFQFTGNPAGTLAVLLGQGSTGSGPSRERYDAGTQRTNWTILASGSPADDYAIRILNVHASSEGFLVAASVGIAMLPGEVATMNVWNVDAGGVLAVGQEVTLDTANFKNAQGIINCTLGALTAANASSLIIAGFGSVYTALTLQGGSNASWTVKGTITTLTMKTGSTIDKSPDTSNTTGNKSVITNSTIDGDCQILDPNNCITWTNATTMNGQVSSGPFQVGPGRTVLVT